MKLLNLFLTLSILCLLVSCSKDEATAPLEEFVTTETKTFQVELPEGITTETAVEWFNGLTEAEIEDYLIKDSERASTRSCSSWGPWSPWRNVGTSIFSCQSRKCPNGQSQLRTPKSRTRIQQCNGGINLEIQNRTFNTCHPPC